MTNLRMPSEPRSAADRWGLWVAILLAALGALVVFSSAARGQERPAIPELVLAPCPDLGAIDAQGPAVLFPRTTADCMLARLRLLPEVVRYADLLEQRIAHDDVRIGLRDREVALAAQEAETATAALEAALRRAREAEEDRDAWYRAPALWFTVGVVATVVLEVVAIWAISEVSR